MGLHRARRHDRLTQKAIASQPAPLVGSANPRRGRDCAGEIPKLVPCKSLKLAYDVRETQVALDLRDPNMDSVLDIHDLGVVITHLVT